MAAMYGARSTDNHRLSGKSPNHRRPTANPLAFALRGLAGLFLAGSLVMGADPAAAQSGVGDRRIVIVNDADFFGDDYRTIKDVPLEVCQQSCLDDRVCKAFTYNSAVNWCFLKSSIGDIQRFAGAVSGRVVEVSADLQRLAAQRTGELGFLSSTFLEEAGALARTLNNKYQPSVDTAAALLRQGAEALNGNQPLVAAERFGQALVANPDKPDAWAQYARALARSTSDNWETRRQLRIDAVSAAVNAYLRAPIPAAQANALDALGSALENRDYTKQALEAWRRAAQLVPAPQYIDAYELARSRYGFRILEHTVEADAASPRICVVFSDDVAPGEIDWSSFVAVDQSGLPVTGEGSQLCVDGARHGERYQVTIRQGLPAANGETLRKSSTLDVYVRDRSPQARFAGSGYVLPAGGRGTVPVVTVNLNAAELEIFRIVDRSLINAVRDGTFKSQISSYQEEELTEKLGEAVWSGTIDVERRLNADVVTGVPVAEAVGGPFEPGVYAMTARVPGDAETWRAAATQWFVVTDLGLAAYSGTDGLHAFTRSLQSADAAGEVTLRLVAANNAILGEATSDAEGYARFDPGLIRGEDGNSPALLVAETADGDYAFLDLTSTGFDLTDRGVDGRTSPGPIDVFVSTERGAYRPGETVHATILARDNRAMALEDLPLTAMLFRPDGKEARRATLSDQGAGGRTYSTELGATAMRGTWRLAIHTDPKKPALAETTLLVEDFVPERIDFEPELPEGALDPENLPPLTLTAEFLYGAPAVGLSIEGSTRLSASHRWDAFPGYWFGVHDERFNTSSEFFGGFSTDDNGTAEIQLTLPDHEPTSQLLTLDAVVRVMDSSGRPVERTVSRPLLPDGPRLGVRPLFDDAVPEGSNARFEAILANAAGERIASDGVIWSIARIERRYQWYRTDDRWRYESVTLRNRVANGEIDLAANEPAAIEAPVEWGQYELTLTTADASVETSYRFYAGWYVAASSQDTPDVLGLSLDKPAYKVGDTATVRLEARFAGKALVMVVDDRIIDMKTVDVASADATVELDVTEDWGPGAYVTAVLVRPVATDVGQDPVRAIGLAWTDVDPGERQLDLAFTTPDQVAPRGPLDAAVKFEGLAAGEDAYVTIAAVDLGILNLTGFEPPAPDEHYFGQRRLGLELRDLYGQLIDGGAGAVGRLRSGGDGALGGFDSPPPTQDLIAYFSGVVKVGDDGTASATFDLPAFNGTVRLMAVAWSASGIGHAVKDVTVRDPIVANATVPRFLAPGDQSRVLIELTHADGPAGEVTAALTVDDGLLITANAAPQTVTLEEGGSTDLLVPIVAVLVGDPSVHLSVTTPDGQVLEQSYRLPVRANDPPIARQNRVPLAAAGGKLTIDADTFAGLMPGTGSVSVALGRTAELNIPALLTALDRYPYGCTEQLTSRALPLVYLDEMAREAGVYRDSVSDRVDEAIGKILANQNTEGGFGVWGPSYGGLWLDAYVTDFLTRARDADHPVPTQAFELALANLKNTLAYQGDFERGGEDLAYALLVLARNSRASIGDLRYYADVKLNDFATPLAKAQLAAALALYGEQLRSDAVFRSAMLDITETGETRRWRSDYGTRLRDQAATLALISEVRSAAVDRDHLLDLLIEERRQERWLNTQENAWTLLAARAMIDEDAASGVTIDGEAVTGLFARSYEREATDASPVVIENAGSEAQTAYVTTFGVPIEPEPASGNGYEITRTFYDIDGNELTIDALPQNQRVVVVLSVVGNEKRAAQLMINDPLPAGYEIDNGNLLEGGMTDQLGWLSLRGRVEHSEARTDRFLAAADVGRDDVADIQIAYVMRAISPGVFNYPAALVEDMYLPEFRAITATGRVEVLGPVR